MKTLALVLVVKGTNLNDSSERGCGGLWVAT